MRTNPKTFIRHLEASLGRFQGNILFSADKRTFMETKDGILAYVEAIEFLRTLKPMKPFQWSEPLQ